jgi:hypothetical protein
MNAYIHDPYKDGEAAKSLKQVEEHLAGEDRLLKHLEEQIQEAERKRHQSFDPSDS